VSQRSAFTPSEWRTLQFAPFWLFGGVSGAYRGFDRLEYEAFTRSLEVAAMAPGTLNQEVMASVAMDVDRLTQAFGADRRSIGTGLCEVAAILRRVPPHEADLLKSALISSVGEGVARARGRFGRHVSEEDAKNLDLVAQFLV
jgi:hypothetical protein